MCIWYKPYIWTADKKIEGKVIFAVVKQLKQLQCKEEFWGFNGIRTHHLRETYQLSYEALFRKQVKIEFDLYPCFKE